MTADQKLNPRQRRRKALHELHAAKMIHARLLGVNPAILGHLGNRSRINIHHLQVLINKETK